MKRGALHLAFICGLLALVSFAPSSQAGVLQLDLTALGRPTSTDQSPNARFQSLVTEIGAALSGGVMSPAESLGYSGFNFGLEMTVTDIKEGNSYWRGNPNHRLWQENGTVANSNQRIPQTLSAARIHVRKGLPLSFELGANMSYFLAGSMGTDLYAIGAELKWTLLHEKFIKQLPDVGVRFAANRLLGPQQLDLTQAQIDFSISYSVGLGGMVNLTPYAGYSLWTVHAITQVLNSAPTSTSKLSGGSSGPLYTLDAVRWNENLQHKAYVGFRFIINIVELLAEADFNIMNLETTGLTMVPTYSFKFGFDY